MAINDVERIASEINSEKNLLPCVIAENQKTVKKSFWKKFARVVSLIPFAHELLSAYYCSIDPSTPGRVRAILLAALAYFILPMDLIPDFIIGLGFSDDATVLTSVSLPATSQTSTNHRQKSP